MSSVGQQLREAREARGLTIQQVAEATKARADHVRALEEGNYKVFSAPVYIRGFIRTYGALVKLNVPPLLAQLDQELGTTMSQAPALPGGEPTFLDRVMYYLSKINWRIALPVLGTALLFWVIYTGYKAWKGHSRRDPLAGVKPALYQPAKTNLDEQLLPLPTPK
jgi:cytoskeletal protein RodZ